MSSNSTNGLDWRPARGPSRSALQDVVRDVPTALLLLALMVLAVRPEYVFGGELGLWAGWQTAVLLVALAANALRHAVRPTVNWPIAALLVILALNLLFANLDPRLTAGDMVQGFVALALPWLFANVVLQRDARQSYALLIALLAPLTVAGALVLHVTGIQPIELGRWLTGTARLHGIGIEADLGFLAFTGFVVAVHEALRAHRPHFGYLACLNLALVITSATRMSMLACAIALAVFCLLSERLRNKLRDPSTAAVAAGGVVLAVLVWYLSYLIRRALGGAGDLLRLSDRTELWTPYVADFWSSPVFGRGIGVSQLVHGYFELPHNEYLHLLVAGGVVGLTLYLVGVGLWFRHLLRKVRGRDRPFVYATVPALAVYASTDNILIMPVALVLFAYFGVLLASSRRRRRRRAEDGGEEEPSTAALVTATWVEASRASMPAAPEVQGPTKGWLASVREQVQPSSHRTLLQIGGRKPATLGLNHFIGALVFVIPLTLPFEFDSGGRLFLPELILLAVLPIMLLARGERLFERIPATIIVIGVLWLLAQITTDLIRGTPYEDYARGWAKIAFFIAHFATLYLLINGKRHLILLFAAGLAIGEILRFVISGEIREGITEDSWKFGLGPAVTLLILVACVQIRSVAHSRIFPSLILSLLGAYSIYMGFRSWGGICTLAAAYLLLPLVLGRDRLPTRFSARHVFALIALVLVGLGTLQGYGYAARAGWLGESAARKYEHQAAQGDILVLLGGRGEILVSARAVADSPILGHGSWAVDPEYARLRALLLEELGFDERADQLEQRLDRDDLLIPTHSHIMGAWVEAGIVGAVFWVVVLGLLAKLLARLYTIDDPLRPLLAFIAFVFFWDILFSPFGAMGRVRTAFIIVLMLYGLDAIAKHLPARYRWQRPSTASRSVPPAMHQKPSDHHI